jgi:hypothetical protein
MLSGAFCCEKSPKETQAAQSDGSKAKGHAKENLCHGTRLQPQAPEGRRQGYEGLAPMNEYVRERTPQTKRYVSVRKYGDGWLVDLKVGVQSFWLLPRGEAFETVREAVWFRRQLAIALDNMIKENIAG